MDGGGNGGGGQAAGHELQHSHLRSGVLHGNTVCEFREKMLRDTARFA
jgi:hypothetical protein